MSKRSTFITSPGCGHARARGQALPRQEMANSDKSPATRHGEQALGKLSRRLGKQDSELASDNYQPKAGIMLT